MFDNIQKVLKNQFLIAPTRENPINLYSVPNLLASGVANTQADGSTMNAALQVYLAECMKFDQPTQLGLTLGDDAVI